MKTLLSYCNLLSRPNSTHIVESEDSNKRSGKWFRLPMLGAFDGGISGVRRICTKTKLFSDDIRGGLKINVKADQESKLSRLIEFLTDLANAHTNDPALAEQVEALNKVITSMSDYMEQADELEGE